MSTLVLAVFNLTTPTVGCNICRNYYLYLVAIDMFILERNICVTVAKYYNNLPIRIYYQGQINKGV